MAKKDKTADCLDLDDWERQIRSTPKGKAAAKELQSETNRFFTAYHRLKAQSGLTTIRSLAQAAGVSPRTVQAIEELRVKPQIKIIQALAKAFGVDPATLNE